MDVSNLIAEYGAYYLRSGQNATRVKQMLLQDTVTTGFMVPIKINDTVYQLSQSSISSIVQGFQKAFTPKGTLKVIPNEIRLRKIKVDFQDSPDDLEGTWLGFLASEAVKRQDWPFVKWLVEAHIIPKIKEEMELEAYGLGVYSAPIPETANSASEALDGLKQLIQLGVDADGETRGIMNHVTGIGDLADATIFDQVEAFVDGINGVYRRRAINIYLADDMYIKYLRDKRAQGLYNLSGDGQIDNRVDFTQIRVNGLPSINGEKFMFATPKDNMLHVTKKLANQTNFNIEESKRQVLFMSDWWEGIGFGINEAVWTTLAPTESV
jgi:hypothetical protein